MDKATIDAAILAHRGWVSRFRTGLDGLSTEYFDVASTLDHNACDLGWWLGKTDTRDLLGAQVHDHIGALHSRFHQICGSLASMLNQRAVGSRNLEQLSELDAISKEIVRLLMVVRDKAQ